MNNKFLKYLTKSSDIINKLLLDKKRVIIAIDGMSGSGKTTFADELSKSFPLTVVHMDDFFLRPEQRTMERLDTPGGNVDIERFLEEVMLPLSQGKEFLYKPFNCHNRKFKEAKLITPERLVIIEGSYSCHPELFDFCDLHIFLYTDEFTQCNRILNRNGFEQAKAFTQVWVPLEDKYFEVFDVKNKCELSFKT
ncbi:MAG: uridine kinase [Ruminococcus sp.]|nr:uridine kinase [Ruminococcus sp.]